MFMRLLLCAVLFIFYLLVSVAFALGTGTGAVLEEGSGSGIPETGSGDGLLEDSCSPSFEGLRVNEVMPNPDGQDRNQEWIELFVPAGATLCDLRIARQDDASKGLDLYELEPELFVLRESLSTGEGSVYLVLEPLSFTLRNSVETIVLLRSSTGEVLQTVTWEEAPSGRTWSWIDT